ncbi:MAG: SCP2 sterol-binding domain-containing protein [Huintestinicola sp.]
MTYEQVFEKAKEIIDSRAQKGVSGHLAVQINIAGEGEGIFYVEFKDGNVYVEPYEYYDRDCILIAKADDLLKICEGKLNPVAAFTTGKLKVEGSIDKALEFNRLLGGK